MTCTSRSPSSPGEKSSPTNAIIVGFDIMHLSNIELHFTPLLAAQKQMQRPLRELKQWCNTDSGKGALREAADRVELSLKGTGFILTLSSS